MKRVCIILLCVAIIKTSSAQTFSEWFRQKKTQKKYLIEQIAALQVYAGYLEKGYSIANEGLHRINSIRHGEFGLHEDYFKSLKEVKASLQNHVELSDIIGLELQIKNLSTGALKQVTKNGKFSPDARAYVRLVFKRLLEGSDTNVDLLTQLITPNLLQMRDDERLVKIENIYDDMQEKYEFVRAFENKIKQLELFRFAEAKEIKTTRQVFDITK